MASTEGFGLIRILTAGSLAGQHPHLESLVSFCPWSGLPEEPLRFCEESLCGWIKQPANTWSNGGFIVIALLIGKEIGKQQTALWRFALVSAATGVGSAFYHASGTMLGGTLDYLGMFLSTALLTGLNLKRWARVSWHSADAISLLTTALLLLLIILYPTHERTIYALAGPCCLLELLLFIRDRHRINYRYYLYASATGYLAFVFWWFDQSQGWCDSTNHLINGHAIWHLLMALALYWFYRYYLQFNLLDPVAERGAKP